MSMNVTATQPQGLGFLDFEGRRQDSLPLAVRGVGYDLILEMATRAETPQQSLKGNLPDVRENAKSGRLFWCVL